MGNERKTQYEILRLLAMYMVVCYHCAAVLCDIYGTDMNWNMTKIVPLINLRLGVDLFAMLTGFFMINKTHIDIGKRILTVLKIVVTYSVLFTVFGALFNLYDRDSLKDVIYNISPIGYSWYTDAYIVLMLLVPFLNLGFKELSTKRIFHLLLGLGICLSVMPSLGLYIYSFEFNGAGAVLWLVFMYLIGGLLNRIQGQMQSIKMICVWGGVLIFSGVCWIGSIYVAFKTGMNTLNILRMQNSIVSLIQAVMIFIIFMKLKVKDYRIINKLARSTLAILLIHNNNIINKHLYSNWIGIQKYWDSQYLALWVLLWGGAVFIGCIIIDLIISFIRDKGIELLKQTISRCRN